MAHPRIGHIGRGHLGCRVEAVDILHQIEDDAEHVEILTAGDEFGMGHRAAGQRLQHRDLALHGAVAVGPRMRRRAAQHQPAVVDTQPHDHVLRAARQRLDIADGSNRFRCPRTHALRAATAASSSVPGDLRRPVVEVGQRSAVPAGAHRPETDRDHADIVVARRRRQGLGQLPDTPAEGTRPRSTARAAAAPASSRIRCPGRAAR